MTSGAKPSSRALFADLEEFVHGHRPHGSLVTDATTRVWNGYLLTVVRSFSALFQRRVTPADADDLVAWAGSEASNN